MEKGERKRITRSNKTPKKDGKSAKARSAEEEARRREVVKEALWERLELEKRALQIVERLLEDSVDEDFLVDCAKFITPANYKDAVEERSIAKLCGYPICPNKLDKIPTQQYKISSKTNKVYDITERKCYCSNLCYKASKDYELQISMSPLWLRQRDSPPPVNLMKKGDGGISGEEVRLLEWRLREEDVENPLPDDPEAPNGPRRRSPPPGLSDDEQDGEQEQDFVSSMVSRQQGPRVHWGDLPKRTDEGEKREGGKMERRRKKVKGEKDDEETQHQQQGGENVATEGGRGEEDRLEETLKSEMELRTDVDGDQRLHTEDTEQTGGQQTLPEERHSPEGQTVDEAIAKLHLCTVTEPVPVSAPVHMNPALTQGRTQEEHTTSVTTTVHTDSNPTESRLQASPGQPGLNITQVAMSRRGAAGLRDLLKTHGPGTTPGLVRLSVLEALRRTLKEWRTDETLRLLCGPDRSSGPSKRGGGEKEREEEELDEDDLEEVLEEVLKEGGGGQGRPSAPVPDYDALKKEAKDLQLRVREFYKGTWVLPGQSDTSSQDQSSRDGSLPLVDSQAQLIIQKQIVVEKLSRSLRDIIGPLRLTMTEVSSDLNNLVRTFRFTNTNIIHKTREWTLIALVLLHVLSVVSPVVKESLESRPSAEYLQTLAHELALQYQDILGLAQLITTPDH